MGVGFGLLGLSALGGVLGRVGVGGLGVSRGLLGRGLLGRLRGGVCLGGSLRSGRLAGPTAMVKGLLVALARPGPVATKVYPTPARSSESVAKVATPFTAATTAVPDNAPPTRLLPRARVRVSDAPATALPPATA